MKPIYLAVLLIIAIFSSCKQNEVSTSATPELQRLENEMKDVKKPELAQQYIKEITKVYPTQEGYNDKINLLKKGLDISEQYNFNADANYFLAELCKYDTLRSDRADYIYRLATRLKTIGKTTPADVLFYGFTQKFSDSPNLNSANVLMTNDITQIDTFLLKLAAKVFENPDQEGINRKNALNYVDACEAYALVYKNDQAANYLYKASEISRTIQTYPKTVALYDWILRDYPNNTHAPTALFLKGYILDDDFNDVDKARQCYQEFLDKYPDNDFADDVKFLMENLGKSDEEIFQIIEKNNPSTK
ncbi:MAG: hypothetical protein R2766_11280 [Saprospiraceae bacterium]